MDENHDDKETNQESIFFDLCMKEYFGSPSHWTKNCGTISSVSASRLRIPNTNLWFGERVN